MNDAMQGTHPKALRCALVALAALGAACGSDSPALDAGVGDEFDAGVDAGAAIAECVSQAGSRLALRGSQSPEGDVFATGMHDTMLDLPCSFLPVGDGLFCLPFTPTRYRSSDCTDPVAVLHNPAEDVPAYHVHQLGDCRGYDYELHAFGAELTDLTTLYFKSGESCEPVSVEGETTDRYFELGATVEPSAFVSAERVPHGTGRLQVLRLDGDDGSRFCNTEPGTAFFDTEESASCGRRYGADDVLRCMPNGGHIMEAATDAACSNEVDVSPGNCGVAEANVGYTARPIDGDSTCPESLEYFERGEMITVYEVQSEVCVLLEGRYFAIGAPVAESGFEPLEEEWVGDGRLQRKLVGDGGGVSLFLGDWNDTELGVPCRASYVGDGVYCAPAALDLRYVSTDPDCETEVILPARDAETCGAADIQFVYSEGNIHALGPAITTPLYDSSTGSCEEVDSVRYTHYEVGAAVDNLVEFTELNPL